MNKKSMKEYRVWRAMKARCYAPSQTKGNYKEYHIGGNCIWIPRRDQSKNRSNSKRYTFGGQTACLKDWARCFGVKYTTAYARICRSGYSFERALEIPSDPKTVNAAIVEYYGL